MRVEHWRNIAYIAGTMTNEPSFSAKLIWTTIGVVMLILGGIGVVLPILPTTPFVLVAAFAFGKGSPRLRKWLMESPIFGPMITDWETHGAIARKYKILACSLMLTSFLASVYVGFAAHILAIQAVFMGGAAMFILTRPDN